MTKVGRYRRKIFRWSNRLYRQGKKDKGSTWAEIRASMPRKRIWRGINHRTGIRYYSSFLKHQRRNPAMYKHVRYRNERGKRWAT